MNKHQILFNFRVWESFNLKEPLKVKSWLSANTFKRFFYFSLVSFCKSIETKVFFKGERKVGWFRVIPKEFFFIKTFYSLLPFSRPNNVLYLLYCLIMVVVTLWLWVFFLLSYFAISCQSRKKRENKSHFSRY